MKLTYQGDVLIIKEEKDVYTFGVMATYASFLLVITIGISLLQIGPEKAMLQLFLIVCTVLSIGILLMTTSKKSLLTIDKSMNTFKLENINLIRVLDTTWSYPLSDLEKMSVDYGLGYRGPASIYFTFYFKGKIPTSFRVGRPHLTHSKFLTLQKTQNLRNREQEIIGPEVAHFLNTKLELRYRGGSVFDARYSKYFKGIKVPE